MSDLDPSDSITLPGPVVRGFNCSSFACVPNDEGTGFRCIVANSMQTRVVDVSDLSDEDAFALTLLLSKLHLKAFT